MQSPRPLVLRHQSQVPVVAWLAPSALLLGLAGLSCLSAGCTGEVVPDPGMSRDASAVLDGGLSLDASGASDGGADLSPRCELPYDQRAIDQVAMGAVTVSPQPGDPTTFTAQVDATAGGSANYGKNPFIYLDLIGGKKVAITDVQAVQSGDWDIAFKRWQIKLNGGSSGPGMVGAVIVADKDLAEVTTAPTDPYVSDDYFDAQCMVKLDPIDGLQTVLSDWYDYDTGTMHLVPRKEVIVLTRRDHKGHIKVQLTAYYKGTVSGNFELSWSLLP